MAERMGNAKDRLYRPKIASRSPLSRNQQSNYLYPKTPDTIGQSKTFSSYSDTYELSLDASASFHPIINQKSRKIDKHTSRSPMNRSFNRFDQLYMNVDQQIAKKTALKALYEKENFLKDIENCTFKPHINKKSKSNSYIRGGFVERNQNWQKYKEHKIKNMKDLKRNNEKQEWTFKPQVSSFLSDNNTSNVCSKSINSDAIEKFVQRQQEARSKKEESRIYEEFIQGGGSACQDSYAWKAHKSK